MIILYFYRSTTSTANSLSSSTNNKHSKYRSQHPKSNEPSLVCQLTSGSNNDRNKNNSCGRRKDVGRPDLLAMTPSRNASLNSNPGSPLTQSKTRHKDYESRLKDHINQLKSERASLQQQIDIQGLAELLSNFHLDSNSLKEATNFLMNCKSDTNLQNNISREIQQVPNLNATTSIINHKLEGKTSVKLTKEQEADLHAQLYLISQEKRSLEMKLEDRHSLESMLRSHIEHLREENDRLSRGEGRLSSLSREDKLGKRVDSLLQTLDRVTKNSEQRQMHSDELMGDLKRANM